MKIKLKKLNSRGFAHHLLIPVIAIVVVAGIGTYIITKSHANTLPGDTGYSWHTIKSWGAYTQTSSQYNVSAGTMYAGSRYRACMDARAKSSSVYDTLNVYSIEQASMAASATFTTTSKTICTTSFKPTKNQAATIGSVKTGSPTLIINSISFQKYY